MGDNYEMVVKEAYARVLTTLFKIFVFDLSNWPKSFEKFTNMFKRIVPKGISDKKVLKQVMDDLHAKKFVNCGEDGTLVWKIFEFGRIAKFLFKDLDKMYEKRAKTMLEDRMALHGLLPSRVEEFLPHVKNFGGFLPEPRTSGGRANVSKESTVVGSAPSPSVLPAEEKLEVLEMPDYVSDEEVHLERHSNKEQRFRHTKFLERQHKREYYWLVRNGRYQPPDYRSKTKKHRKDVLLRQKKHPASVKEPLYI